MIDNEDISQLLFKGRLRESILILLKDDRTASDAIELLSRFEDIKNRERAGVIDSIESGFQINKIIASVVELASI